MYRVDLANKIKTIIDESLPESWPGELKLGTAVESTASNYIPVRVALDPFTDAKVNAPHVFVIPGYKQFSVKEKRNKLQPSKNIIFITIALAVRLTEFPSDEEAYDTAPATEWSKLLKLKDDLDAFLYDFNYSSLDGDFKSLEIREPPEAEPADEVELDARYFLETTVIGYVAC